MMAARPFPDATWLRIDAAAFLEDCTARDGHVRHLAELLAASFRVHARHRTALVDEARWRGCSPQEALLDLAAAAVAEAVDAPTIEEFVSRGRAALERALRPPRMADDAELHVPVEDAALVSSEPSPEEAVAALELEDAVLDCPDLTEGERSVMAARIRLGPGATAAEIAAETGYATGSVRHLTSRARTKLVHVSRPSTA